MRVSLRRGHGAMSEKVADLQQGPSAAPGVVGLDLALHGRDHREQLERWQLLVACTLPAAVALGLLGRHLEDCRRVVQRRWLGITSDLFCSGRRLCALISSGCLWRMRGDGAPVRFPHHGDRCMCEPLERHPPREQRTNEIDIWLTSAHQAFFGLTNRLFCLLVLTCPVCLMWSNEKSVVHHASLLYAFAATWCRAWNGQFVRWCGV